MTTYRLYLESGPKRRKTMVHALDLLGCVAVGPTTEAALDATPAAIAAYRRFLHRHGEAVAVDAPFETLIVEHVTEGEWLGNGSPYLTFEPDFTPLGDDEVELLLRRVGALRETLADWAERQAGDTLDADPTDGGRPGRAILLHVLGACGAYFSAALGGAPGFSALYGAAERGEIGLPEALRRSAVMTAERFAAATPAERNAVRELSSRRYTLRKAFRRALEHDWEHLAELARRPGGPAL